MFYSHTKTDKAKLVDELGTFMRHVPFAFTPHGLEVKTI